MERAKKWLAQSDFPCADISYWWASGEAAALIAVMHFSRVVDGFRKDLELTFRQPLAVQWEDEAFGLVESPEDLPKCSGKFSTWTYPTLIVDGSRWASRYAACKYAESDPRVAAITHYFLVSMSDSLHVLNEGEPESKWINDSDAYHGHTADRGANCDD
jgi:hypothetical protein